MPQRYQELKVNYDNVINKVCGYHARAEKRDIERYLLSITLRIWFCNTYYANEYGESMRAIQETPYTMEQIVTAMACCGEGIRGLRTPNFLKEIESADAKKDIINCIGDYLAAAALINGDFTTEEAACWTELMETLAKRCLNERVHELDFNFIPKSHITKLNSEGYYKSYDGEKKKKTTDEGETHSNNANGQDTTVLDLVEKVNKIVDAIKVVDQNADSGVENAKVSNPNEKSLEELLEELDGLVGLDKVKSDVRSLMNFIKVANMRRKKGLKVPTISYHLVFTGNPGTGKTTIARLVAQIYYKMGLLTKGQLVETDRSALVAGYLGQTAIKTQKVIQEALGGVLFIDEAYALAGEGEDSYGKEAIETLLKGMEDHRDDLVVIVAGYDELMHRFIDSNPGLRSRFNKFFSFPDYNGDELVKIFDRFCENNGYAVSSEVTTMLLEKFSKVYETREEHFGNARAVRNVFETAICCQANRIANHADVSEEDLVVLTKEDVQLALEEEFAC